MLFAGTALAQVDVLTANYDNDRTNANLHESALNTSNVNADQFGKVASFQVDGQIYAQPLYVSGLEMPDKGVHNVVYVATMHNSVYAFDADATSADGVLWSENLGPPVSSDDYNFDDIDPEVGILSTPVIDRASLTMYVVTDTCEDGAYFYRLHALDITNGQEKFGGPGILGTQVFGNGDDSQDGIVSFDAFHHLQRPGLLLLNGVVYIAFGSHDDARPFHGWLMGYDATNVQRQVRAFTVTPNGAGGSIWQSGRGPAADALGNIYVITANGSVDGMTEFSQSFLKLDAGYLAVRGSFTPPDWETLNDDDNDLGSCGPVLVPGTDLVIGGSKAGDLLVVHRSGMTPVQGGSAQGPSIGVGIFTMALWNHADGPIVYVRADNGSVQAFRMVSERFDPVPFAKSDPVDALPYQGLAVSASGSTPGSGVMWMSSGDDILHAYDAADVSHELWNSSLNEDRDALEKSAKFASPTVANGRVYMATFSNQLVVYGLLP